MNYAGFWRRLGAYLIDFVVLTPIMALGAWGTDHSQWFQALWLIPGTLFGWWFSVQLVRRHGGTPGKLLMGTRIVMSDGSPVTPRAATVRYAVMFVLSLLSSVALAYACLVFPSEHYQAMSFMQKSQVLDKLAPVWYHPLNIVMQVWVWSEFLVILFNKRKRALHDFMADTVVVLKRI